ncbi:MAG: glycine dehydrogenase (aminomethyl-transferring), partial [Cyanobacteria bacterium J06628_6]
MSYDQNDVQNDVAFAPVSETVLHPPGQAQTAASWIDALNIPNDFPQRHVGPTEAEVAQMLSVLGYDSLASLMTAAVPAEIRLNRELALESGVSEPEALAELGAIAHQNQIYKSYIGLGYANTFT